MRNPYILFYELMKKNPPSISNIKQQVVKQQQQQNGHPPLKGASDTMFAGNSIKTKSHPSLIRDGLNFNKYNNASMNGKSTDLTKCNGSTSGDLGHVVERKKEDDLLTSKDRQPVSFAVKPNNIIIKTKPDINRTKMIIRSGAPPLLNTGPKILSPSTCNIPAVNSKVDKSAIVVSKPSSTAQAIAELKKGKERANSLVPYNDDDSDDSDDSQKGNNGHSNGPQALSPPPPSSSNSSSEDPRPPKKKKSRSDWVVTEGRETDTCSVTSSSSSNSDKGSAFTVVDKSIDQQNSLKEDTNGWEVLTKDENSLDKPSQKVVQNCNGLQPSVNDGLTNGCEKTADNSKLNGNSKLNNNGKLNGNANRTCGGESDSENEESDSVRFVPAVNKLAWDRHSKGDLKYKLSSHQQQNKQENGECGYRPETKPIWTNSERDDRNFSASNDVVSEMMESRNYCFGTKGKLNIENIYFAYLRFFFFFLDFIC